MNSGPQSHELPPPPPELRILYHHCRQPTNGSAQLLSVRHPPDLPEEETIPDYAGLMIVTDDGCTEEEPAPRIHSDNLSDKDRRYIERGLAYRYWNQRMD